MGTDTCKDKKNVFLLYPLIVWNLLVPAFMPLLQAIRSISIYTIQPVYFRYILSKPPIHFLSAILCNAGPLPQQPS